jgi:hypothetical protein
MSKEHAIRNTCRFVSGRLIPALAALLLAACAQAPVVPAAAPWSLKEAKTVSVHFPDEPARTYIGFNTKGFTLIGAIYVGMAMSKMRAQTEEMGTDLAAYLKAHPEVPSLQDVFNRELENQLRARGVAVEKISATRKVVDNKMVSYAIDPAEAKSQVAVVVDGLIAGYFAPSVTHQYNPRSRILFTVLDASAGKQLAQIELHDEANLGDDTQYAYKDFPAVKESLPQAYEGLQRSVIRLASDLADALMQTPKATM